MVSITGNRETAQLRTAKIKCPGSRLAVRIVSGKTQERKVGGTYRNKNNDALDDVDQKEDPVHEASIPIPQRILRGAVTYPIKMLPANTTLAFEHG